MKFIEKGTEPISFTNWKNSGTRAYGGLRNPVKSDLKNALISEQGHICCYCESKITSDTSHIEHLDPQCSPTNNDLDYANLLCSCQKQLAKGEPRHCGNSKGNNTITIHPLQNNCEIKFTYTADGCINYTDKNSKDTIEILQLNINKLNNLRAEAIEPFIIGITDAELKDFVRDYLKRKDGKYNEFYTTIKYLFQ